MTPREFAALPPVEAIAYMASRGVVLPADYYLRVGAYRLLAFSIAGVTALDTLQLVLDTLTEALQNGETFAAWRKRAAADPEIGALPRHRQETIFRTNVQGAYARGTYQRQAEVVDRRPYLMYDAINDARTRPSHRAMDGFVARHDDPIWRKWRAPGGYNCRCSLQSLTETQARERGYGTQSPPNAEPDPGWDYDRAQGIAPGVQSSVARRAEQGGALVERAADRVEAYRRAARA